MMNLILCGLPLSGKSTLGKELSRVLGWGFCDTDRMVEERYYQKEGVFLTNSEIFLKYGEEYFRDLEEEVVRSLKNLQGTVIATGGGVLLREVNRASLKEAGILLYLKVELCIILERLKICKEIPVYLDLDDCEGSYFAIAKKRIGLYEETCDLLWETE